MEEVSIRLLSGSSSLVDLSSLQGLRILRLAAPWKRLNFNCHPAAQITHLELAFISIDVHFAREMMSRYLHLRFCVLHIGLEKESSLTTLRPFESQVGYLHLACASQTQGADMLEGGTFPRLHTLSVQEDVDRAFSRQTSVFSTLSPTAMPALRALSLAVTSFDVPHVHILTRLSTLVSLNLPHSTIGTESQDIITFLMSLTDPSLLPSLKHLSAWLEYTSHTLTDDGIFQANKTMVAVVKARQPTLERFYLSFPGLVTDWRAGFHILPRLKHVMDENLHYRRPTRPSWIYDLWPHVRYENIFRDTFAEWLPPRTFQYGRIKDDRGLHYTEDRDLYYHY